MRRLLLLVGAIVFVDTMFFAALTPLLPHYADEFGLSKAGAGVLQAAYPLGALAGGLPAGLASARIGVRPTVLAGLLLMAATTAAFGFADSVALLDAARFAQGLASSAAWTGGLAWLVAEAPPERRGEMIGSAMGAAIAGALFGPALGALASFTGTRTAFGVVGLLALALATRALATEAPVPGERQSLGTLWRALGDRRIQAGIWFVALPSMLFGTLGVLTPLRLSALGWSALAIGATYLCMAGLEALLSPIVGRISDRRGRLLPIRAGLLASAATTAVLPWPPRAWLLAVLVVLAGMAFGTFWAPAMSLLSDSAEQVGLGHGLAFALVNLAWAPGQALGSAGGGALARQTADQASFLVLSAACLASLAALSLVRRSRSNLAVQA
jgi:predicted MFS family arabinose efflux permease